jgi:hypothetical protein
MKRIVICEGKTDAILVGYFLIKVYGWQFVHNTRLPTLPFDKKNESLCWYVQPARPEFELAVWGAGGITRVPEKLSVAIERTRVEHVQASRFERFVLLIDRDNRTIEQTREMIEGWCDNAGITVAPALTIGQWTQGTIQLSKTPPEPHGISVLPIVLPPTQEGCLEVFLSEALRAIGEDDRQIVDGCRDLVASIPDQPYLSEPRFRPKAVIGATLSIMSPDWVFGDLDEKLTAIEWEKIQDANAAYERLGDL